MDVEDEKFLFANFQDQTTGKPSKSKKSKKRKLVEIAAENGEPSMRIPEEIAVLIEQKDKYVQQLEEQNNKLKAVIKRLCGPQDLSNEDTLWKKGCLETMPMAVILFLNNDLSYACKNDLEKSLSDLVKREIKPEEINEIQSLKSQSSAVPLRAFAADTKGKRVHKAKAASDISDPHILSSVQYYIDFCLDRTGLPLLDNNPAITQIWSIPIYDQVFLNALPLVTDGEKIFIKAKKTVVCFNCLGEHILRDCDQPRNHAKIRSNRNDFQSKFGSPGADSRYHQGESERFKDFKAGQVSSALREALGINEKELPPYIYKMRSLGYPPGYLKSNESGLIMYGKEGEIEEKKTDAEEGEIDSIKIAKDISYEGFNAPLSEGTIDRSYEYGMPSFEESYSLDRSSSYSQGNSIRSSSTPRHHERDRYSRERHNKERQGFEEEAQEMELDDSIVYSNVELSVPVLDLTSDQEGSLVDRTSDQEGLAPLNHVGANETPPPPLPHSTPEKPPPPPGVYNSDSTPEKPPPPPGVYNSDSTPEKPPPPPGVDNSDLALNPLEIGQLLEKAEIRAKKSKIVDTYLAQGQPRHYENQSGSSHRQWWLGEPISASAGILYFTYTPPPTIKGDVKVEDVIRNTIWDIDREPWKTDSTSWYDPLYGDLAAPTGIYDSIKEILKKRKKRRQLRKV